MASNTKFAIIQAYADLMTRKNADKVTVKDVVEACGITRQTFYYHFQDLLDVIEWGLQRRAGEALNRGLQAESLEEALYIFLSAADENRPLSRKILSSQKKNQICDIVLHSIQNWLFIFFKERNTVEGFEVEELDFAMHFYANAIAGAVYDIVWDEDADIRAVAGQIVRLMDPVVSHMVSAE